MERWKIFLMIGFALATLLLASSASAQLNFLKNPGFEEFTGVFPIFDILADDSSTWGKWTALGAWKSVFDNTIEATNFAQEKPESGDVTLQIMQAFDGSLAPNGTTLILTFKYLYQGPCWNERRVRVVGLQAGGIVDHLIPNNCTNCAELYNDEPIGENPDASLVCVDNNVWKTYGPVEFPVNADFKAIYVGIVFGGQSTAPPIRAIDDVFLGLPNRPPVCKNAYASKGTLWPANNRFAEIEILGVTDPDGDPFTITIDSIYQDEPVDSTGDGAFAPDGTGIGKSKAYVRAERAGSGNGRVYHIKFTADDGLGEDCTGHACDGEVLVTVPKSQGRAAVDDVPLYDSTVPF